jgi:phage N-6-adenine-methyltransferase
LAREPSGADREGGVSVLGFSANNHPQQVGRRGARPEIDDRATAPELFAGLNERFAFTLDAAASQRNTKCARYFTRAIDGLSQPWTDERVWCNPPYSDIRPWLKKAWMEVERAQIIVMLLPANRTEQGWWQEFVEPYRDNGKGLRVEFISGRQRFIGPTAGAIGPNERPPFGVCLLIWELA